VPRALWGIWERGTIGLLSRDLASPFLRDVWTDERKQRLVEYFVRTNLHDHNFYAMRFFVCELLNFLNSVGHSRSFEFPLSPPSTESRRSGRGTGRGYLRILDRGGRAAAGDVTRAGGREGFPKLARNKGE